MSEVNEILGFKIGGDDYEIELESGWIETASPFGINTSRDVFDVVFWKGSDGDLRKLLSNLSDVSEVAAASWLGLILSAQQEWTYKDQMVFDHFVSLCSIRNAVHETIKLLGSKARTVDGDKRHEFRQSFNIPLYFLEATDDGVVSTNPSAEALEKKLFAQKFTFDKDKHHLELVQKAGLLLLRLLQETSAEYIFTNDDKIELGKLIAAKDASILLESKLYDESVLKTKRKREEARKKMRQKCNKISIEERVRRRKELMKKGSGKSTQK